MVRACAGQIVPAAVSSWTISERNGAEFDDGVKKYVKLTCKDKRNRSQRIASSRCSLRQAQGYSQQTMTPIVTQRVILQPMDPDLQLAKTCINLAKACYCLFSPTVLRIHVYHAY